MEETKQLQQLSRELMVINADYTDLVKRLEEFSQKVHKLFEKIDTKLNGKDVT